MKIVEELGDYHHQESEEEEDGEDDGYPTVRDL